MTREEFGELRQAVSGLENISAEDAFKMMEGAVTGRTEQEQ